MRISVELPEGLADLRPGPQLAAALAGIDIARVANNQLLPVLLAQSRQAAHEAARLLGVIAEIGRANPTFDDDEVDRLPHPFVHAADEIRAALAWSRRAADRESDLAEQLVHDIPLVYAAFLDGSLDRSKVRVFADHLTGLTAAQIHQVCQTLVPIAGRLTPGQLVHRLRRLVAAIDPRHYERRYRKALRDRVVSAWLDDTGAAVLSARGLSPAQAAAAVERIDLLAHAARRTGHASTLDQIRVDIVAGLLDGTLHHLNREQIIAHLIANRAAHDDAPAAADPPTNDVAAHAGAPGATADAGAAAGAGAPADAARAPAAGAAPDAEAAGGRDDQRTGVEIRVALSTLLGHDEHPGDIPGLGPVAAAEARATVTRQRRAEWRFAIVDGDGRLVFDGLTRRRPIGLLPNGPPGGIVEIHIPVDLLEHLTIGVAAPDVASDGWAAVLADVARRYADRDRRDLDAHPADRFPRAGLRRHTQIRDRSCVGPGCRQRPMRCDQDHTVDHQHGGETVADDLAPLCRHDHTLKTRGGWHLDQPEAGRFVWTSPLGGHYDVRPEPVLPPLPAPRPGDDDPIHDEPAPAGDDTFVVYAPEPPPPPPPGPPPDDPDEPPPF